jgi:dihydroxyacid dehydratase/phosphogluconate dehydratase
VRCRQCLLNRFAGLDVRTREHDHVPEARVSGNVGIAADDDIIEIDAGAHRRSLRDERSNFLIL